MKTRKVQLKIFLTRQEDCCLEAAAKQSRMQKVELVRMLLFESGRLAAEPQVAATSN